MNKNTNRLLVGLSALVIIVGLFLALFNGQPVTVSTTEVAQVADGGLTTNGVVEKKQFRFTVRMHLTNNTEVPAAQ